eukprot:393459_1
MMSAKSSMVAITVIGLFTIIFITVQQIYLWNSTGVEKRTIQLSRKYKEDILYSNPLRNNLECRNAIINKENIDIHQLLNAFTNEKCPISNTTNTTIIYDNLLVWSRESIDAISNNQCYKVAANIRLPQTHTSDKKKLSKNIKRTKAIPTYYQIVKCGSSSIKRVLEEYSTSHSIIEEWHSIGNIGDNSNRIHTDCGFTFVRNPITRFIAGYYTIHLHMFEAFNKTFDLQKRKIIKRNDIWNNVDLEFMSVYKEP